MMELTRAEQQIIDICRERITRWGKHADIPAQRIELGRLIVKLADSAEGAEGLHDHAQRLQAERNELREEVTKLNRQLGAAKARESKLRKAAQQQGDEHASNSDQ